MIVILWSYTFGSINDRLRQNGTTVVKERNNVIRTRKKCNGKSFLLKYEVNEKLMNESQYEIICEDAVQWLHKQELLDGYVITSLPDYTEIGKSVEEWKKWFTDTVALILRKLPDNTCAIFYQTDCKILESMYDEQDSMERSMCKEWIDKSRLCFLGAEQVNDIKLLWHKIMLCAPVESVKLGRPGYSHMLCFAKNKYDNIGRRPLPDVIDRGDMIYRKAMGINACMLAVLFCKNAGAKKIIDPFCGKGSVMLSANYLGLDAVGVDISSTRCRNAKSMRNNNMQSFIECVQNRSFMQAK